ncbi:Lipoprotein-anchoring transpeptidase ErfK/SrfK [Pseudomonas syringae pv. actinidiae]|uniref:Lipoprotein-anchoring transpeptidase ErfK/SrfK n=1 Tax=Pseudomonas syringae pv. actinidiae TaxID=103796 RepID=A0A2V0Q8S0_PSESF|nr:Lipoprotein-anchoring transpeptidase ErfK/SrfK [Pseudomonas syringae pv. actinidiae]
MRFEYLAHLFTNAFTVMQQKQTVLRCKQRRVFKKGTTQFRIHGNSHSCTVSRQLESLCHPPFSPCG